jgi:hypothetical protein
MISGPRVLIKHSSYCEFLERYLDSHDLLIDSVDITQLPLQQSDLMNREYIITPLLQKNQNHYQQLMKIKNLELVLDLNHYHFGDLEFALKAAMPKKLYGPLIFEHPNFVKIESLYANHLKTIIGNFEVTNKDDFLFVSQPLLEDGREIDQHDLIRYAHEMVKTRGAKLFIKRHQRESKQLTCNIYQNENVLPYEDSIEEGIKTFNNLIGFNSLPLLASKVIGRNVYLWDIKKNSFNALD